MQNKARQKLVVLWLAAITILSAPLVLVNCGKKKANDKIQIVLISIDTLRGDHLESYGYFRNTSPNLSRLIKDSVYYTNAYTNGCWTMPSHMSLLTGTLPSRHGINKDWRSVRNKQYPALNESTKNIAEILKSHNKNIKTVKFAKLPGALGFGKGYDRDERIDPFLQNKKFDMIIEEFENSKEKDFFFFIHTWMVHAPYSNTYFLKEGKIDKKKRDYIDNFRTAGIKEKKLSEAFSAFLKENNLFNSIDCVTLYDGGIRYVDEYIGKIINKFKQLGIYDDMMVIVVSDHGEHFEEHFPRQFYGCHGKDFYEEFIKVPIIIKYPHSFKRGTIDYHSSLIDIFPTLLDFYEIPPPPFIQGESLLKPHKKRNKNYIVSEAISGARVERKMIRVGDLKYIITMKNPSKPGRANWDSITGRKLFDLKEDPSEKNNLYKNLKYRQICIDFEKTLKRIIKNSARTNRTTKKTEISEETIKQLEALGYL
jgi:arylsulfatase A-like enzyme